MCFVFFHTRVPKVFFREMQVLINPRLSEKRLGRSTPQSDKLEFAGEFAERQRSGILSPEGGIFLAQGAAAIAAEPWVWYKE